jgi:hypothetical protein
MPFLVVEYPDSRIIEVIYPSTITALDHAEYTIQMKQMIEKQSGAWGLLVDQRAHRIDEKLKSKLLVLYGYAQSRGMKYSARIVNSSVEAIGLTELLRGTGLISRLRVFTDRNKGFDWLEDVLQSEGGADALAAPKRFPRP